LDYDEFPFKTYHPTYDRFAQVMQHQIWNRQIENLGAQPSVQMAEEIRSLYSNDFTYVMIGRNLNHTLDFGTL